MAANWTIVDNASDGGNWQMTDMKHGKTALLWRAIHIDNALSSEIVAKL